MTIATGRLLVQGGMTVTSTGISVTDGFTIAGGGLLVQQGGIQVPYYLNIAVWVQVYSCI